MDKSDEADIRMTREDVDGLDGPQPETKKKPIAGLIALFAALGATILVPILCTMHPTRGATRSARIEWQQRHKEIQLAAREAADAAAEADDGQRQTR